MDIRAVWDQILGNVESRVSEMHFRCWIASIEPREVRDDAVIGEVPSRMHLEEIRRRGVEPELQLAVEHVLGAKVRLELAVGAQRASAETAAKPRTTRFEALYTFDRFVTGASNLFAYRSSVQIAERPGETYNPLFLCGRVGLGKTHLATAVAHSVLRVRPGARVLLLSAEAFANELIGAFRVNGTETFRSRFRKADVLIIDDVQFFAGKERMQEEFFHTFNALHKDRKQIVLASDQPPRDIPGIEERLRSRFESGLTADIQPPDLPLRLAIVTQKAKWLGLELPMEVLRLVATRIVSSVRELEGALHRLAAAAKLGGQALDLGIAMQILRPVLRMPPPKTVEQVQRVVAEQFRVAPRDLICRQRATRVLLPRQVAMYLARNHTRATYAEIAEGFGGRNHTTVLHAVRSVEQRRAVEPEFAAILDRLESRLQADQPSC